MTDTAPTGLIQYKDDGTVRLALDKVYRLRRPTVGDLRAIREGMVAAADETADMVEDHQDALADLAAEHGVDIETDPKVEAAGVLLGAWSTLVADMPDAEARTKTLAGWLDGQGEAHDPAPQPKEYKRAVRDANRDLNRQIEALWYALGRETVSRLGGKQTLPEDDGDLDPAWVRGSAVIPAATAVERARADLTDDELAAAADPTGAP